MRSICRKGAVALTAVLAVCAIGAVSASAAQWYVNGKAMTKSEKLSETVKIQENIVFTIEYSKPKYDATITCTSMQAPKAELVLAGPLKLGAVTFGGCALNMPPEKACKLSGSNIGTTPLEAKMAVSGPFADTSEWTAEGGSKTQWFGFTGGCEWFEGESTIKGTVALKAPDGQIELGEQEFAGQGETAKGLTWHEQPVYLSGKLKLKLASGAQWSYH